ncbi:MAG: porin family protein [candidate division Zixibacteria bacterium]|nr:porin family protein [candidate division Zixibacteria bacterium]
MKSIAALIPLALLISATAQADQYVPGVTGYGVKMGLDFATIGTNISEFEGYDSFVGGVIGVFVNYGLSPKVALQPELYFTGKGAGGEIIGGRNWRHQYFELPVLLKYCFSPDRTVKPHLFCGPAIALLTSAEFQSSIISDVRDMGDASNSFDLGFAFGGDLTYKRLVFDLRYTIGMVKVYDPDEWNEIMDSESPSDLYHMASDEHIKNRNVALTIGFRL